MPLSDPERLFAKANNPRIVCLWRALQPLRSVVSFMNTGAHPDDETSSMLAALSLRDGLSVSYACANRGEGGQNEIGLETAQDLGVLRTAEMERAADVLNLRLYWLSESPQDPVHDFGFSKSGQETLARWGHDRTLERLVDIIRIERPDIICPTFLDMPGQHGHHCAMTQIAQIAFDAAADPGFVNSARPPWQVKKLYLPAWSGAGDAYDDDLPPPAETLRIDANGDDPISGMSWAQIGQLSRAFHRTQGMGRWVPYGASNTWPLHLARTVVDSAGNGLTDGLCATMADLAVVVADHKVAALLKKAQSACDEAIATFPDFDRVLETALRAITAIRTATDLCPASAREDIIHRLDLKQQQLSHVIRLAAGADAQASLARDMVRPGETTQISIETRGEKATAQLVAPHGWSGSKGSVTIGAGSAISNPYPTSYIPGVPAAPAIRLSVEIDGVATATGLPLSVPPLVVPQNTAAITPHKVLLNTRSQGRTFDVTITDIHPAGAMAELIVPVGWTAVQSANNIRVTAPAVLPTGLYELPLTVNGQKASTVKRIVYPHIAPRVRCSTACVRILAVDVALPKAKIGYFGGGSDRVGDWLNAAGMCVTALDDAALNVDELATFDTIVIGIFALRTRPTLRRCIALLHQWVEKGGNLVTLYHRPWDAWDPVVVPPRRLTIGKPSLRWRVTDQNAWVTHLDPQNELLNRPNVIQQSDWQGWHKERGLYFAMDWDPAYTPLLSMADPGEKPHGGALLTARIGKGRHTHTSLILHHQMDMLVPGAFRIMANLVANE